MGHTRLGNIPTGKKWKVVVAALAASNQDTVSFGIMSDDVERKYVREKNDVLRITGDIAEDEPRLLRVEES